LRRYHLLELHEHPACPASWRDGMTDFLQIGMRATGMFTVIVPRLGELLARTGQHRVVDLCAGGGGAWLGLLPRLRAHAHADVAVLLTDLFPSAPARRRVAGVDGVAYLDTPVDARSLPPDLGGVRTLFNALHQFRPDEARKVLADAVAARQPIAAFEATDRSWLGLFLAISLPGLVWLLTPFVRPFSWSRLFWTYVIPVLPFFVAHDAVISCLRTYDLDDLDRLVEGLGGERWRWERGRTWSRGFPNRITWLVGTPIEADHAG
jgi:hypothetical protein